MRSDKEMLDIILSTATEDNHIRAVILNGSRANKNIKNDIFQDFDICYIVTDIEPFKDLKWIKRFGDIMILQQPNLMGDTTPRDFLHLTYLMQFMDGTRIDLSIVTLNEYDDEGELWIVLLDKDGILSGKYETNIAVYNIKPPTKKQFEDCCNEFWWLCPYIAKGIWREELSYAMEHMDCYLRKEYMKMISWYIGVNNNFAISTGKTGKYIKQYLSKDEWSQFEKTYPGSKYDDIWNSLFVMGESFRRLATVVSEHFGFLYPKIYDENVSDYLKDIRKLPKNANQIR